ncbi:MAG: hypothetical protein FD167_5478 [bacterium]|nr:MAG: hypothetical protein FD167_5478 [bacterium]
MDNSNNKAKYNQTQKGNLDLDRRFKRCVLEYLYVSLLGDKASKSFREAVADNIAMALTQIDSEDFECFKETVQITMPSQ